MTPAELEARLREWARMSSAPLTAPPPSPPSLEEVTERLREAAALWIAAAKLGDLRRSR